MNNLFKKIATAFVGIAMAVGVGVAVGKGSSVRSASATEQKITLSNIGSNISSTSTSNHNGTFTASGYGFSYYGKKQGNAVFVPKSADSGFMYNTTAIPGDIVSVKITTNSGAAGGAGYAVAFSANAITSRYTTGGTTQTLDASTTSSAYTNSVSGARYFCVYMSNTKNGQVLSMDITYDDGVAGKTTINEQLVGPANFEMELGSQDVDVANDISLESGGPVSGYTLSSSNTSVVTISGTTLHAVALGTSTITISKEDVEGDTTITKYESAQFVVTVAHDPIFVVEGNEIVFANLYLANSTQYLEEFKGTDFKVSFTGGDNDGKYYTTGSAIRIYSSDKGDGVIHFAALNNKVLSKVELTFDGTYAPATSKYEVSTGSYDVATATWTGSAESFTLTNTAGSGHWRLQSVSATVATPVVHVSSVTLDDHQINLETGKSYALEATVLPENADDKSVTWTSSDESVATVDGGVVTGVAAGTATITVASVDDPTKTDTCEVTVVAPTVYHTVTLKAGDGTGDDVVDNHVEHGTQFTLPACSFTAPEGYEFDAWKVGDDTVLRDPEYKVTVEDDVEIVAQWKELPPAPEYVDVTFDLNYENAPQAAVSHILKGTAVEEPENPERNGYNFLGWFKGEENEPFDFTQNINENLTLKAKWEAEQVPPTIEYVDVTFNLNYNEAPQAAVSHIEKGTAVDKPQDPEREGYNFLGWFLENATEEFVFTTLINENTELFAHWELKPAPQPTPASLVVSYQGDNPKAGETLQGEIFAYIKYSDDSVGTEDVAEDCAYYILDGQQQEVAVNDQTVFEEAGEVTIYARYSEGLTAPIVGQVTITVDAAEVPPELSGKATIDFDAKHDFADIKESNTYEGVKFIAEKNGGNNDPVLTQASQEPRWSLKLYAKNKLTIELAENSPYASFKSIQCTVTSKNGTTAGQGDYYKENVESTALYEHALTTGTFVQGNKVDLGGASKIIIVCSAGQYRIGQIDIEFYKQGETPVDPTPANKYTVTFDSNGGSAVDPAQVEEGQTVAKPADPTREGYTFAGWFLGEATTAYDFTTPVTAAITLVAHWTENGGTTPTPSTDPIVLTGTALGFHVEKDMKDQTVTYGGVEYKAHTDTSDAYLRSYTNGHGSNEFSTDTMIMMGKKDAYLYNNSALPAGVSKIEIVNNNSFEENGETRTPSTAVKVAIEFGKSAMTTALTGEGTQLDEVNKVFTYTPSESGCTFFRLQIMSNHNAQFQMKIYFGEPAQPVSPTGISLDKTTASVEAGKTVTLTASLTPSGATGTITWETSDATVATVANGVVTGVKAGSATITAKCGTLSATCAVTVTEASGGQTDEKGSKTNPYTVSEAWALIDALADGANNGKVVYVTGTVSGEVSFNSNHNSGTFLITDGTKTIKAYSIGGVSVTEGDSNYVADGYTVVVGGALIKYGSGENLTYEVGYASGFQSELVSTTPGQGGGGTTPATSFTVTFNSDGGSAVAPQTVNAGATATKPADPTKEGYTFAGWYLGDNEYNFSSPVNGNITLVAHWTQNSGGEGGEGGEGGGSTPEPAGKNVTGIEVSGFDKLNYQVGQELDLSELKVIIKYSDGTFDVATADQIKVSGYDASKAGQQEVTISVGDQTWTVKVMVTDAMGCHGSVVAGSALISLTTLLGAGLLMFKKRKED